MAAPGSATPLKLRHVSQIALLPLAYKYQQNCWELQSWTSVLRLNMQAQPDRLARGYIFDQLFTVEPGRGSV